MVNHGNISDSGIEYVIIPRSRNVIVPAAYRVIGTVGSLNSEEVTIKCPKIIDGHEIQDCSRKYITWNAANGTPGQDGLKIRREDAEYVYFAWKIGKGLTVAAGIITFAVHFVDVDEEGEETYRWDTTIIDVCKILDTVNAPLNTYKSIYVDGHTLVFANYTVVNGNTLELKSDSEDTNGNS